MIPPFQDGPAAMREMTRRSFLFFLMRAFPYISGGQQLLANWHLSAMAFQLERVMNGDCLRLLVNLPPRNLKSITISVAWVAWMLGRDPTLNFVCVSYSNELSGKLARDCRTIMQSPWYREAFPGTIVSERRATMDFETTLKGGRLATSITGTLTGRGGDIIILDDVIKPDDADSDVIRESVNEWYRSTLASRLNDKATGAIIAVMQRLHQFDLPGMLLEAGGWQHLCLPAIADCDARIPLIGGKAKLLRAGEILHPERESAAGLMAIKAEMGSVRFASQYLQNPVPAEGNLKSVWLKTYPKPPDAADGGYIIQSWDTANKAGPNNAYSACITARVKGRYIYVLDVLRKRMEFPELRATAIGLARGYKVSVLLIEDKASGEQLIQEFRDPILIGLPMPIPVRPEGDKESRIAGVSAMIEAGQLLLPREAPWLPELKSELLGFSHTRFRDQVDALSQFMSRVRLDLQVPEPMLAGPILVGASSNWDDDERFPEGVTAIRRRSGYADEFYCSPSADDPWL